jgi:hypothetical protein
MLRLRWMEVRLKRAPAKMRLLSAISMILVCSTFALALMNSGAAAGGPPVFSPDKGKLVIQLNGETIGSEQFELTQSGNNWLAKGTTELKVPGAAATSVSGTLMLQPDGAPISYEWTSHADKTNGAHVVFSNGTAKITLQMQGATRPFEQDLSFNAPVIAVLDNNLYDQYALLAKLYDWTKRGTQTFPVLIPQDLTPGTISVAATGSQTADGKSYEGLRVTTSDLEVLLLLDSNHRLMRLEVPSAKVSVVRQ